MMKLSEKLQVVQQTLNAPKDKYNAFGKYSYRSFEGICEGVKPLLASQGLTLVVSDELVLIGERYYVKAIATLSDGTDSITATAYAREEESKKGMDSAQVTGATSSYARKYALNGLFLIDDVKDPDSSEYQQASKGESNKATKEQIAILKKAYGESINSLLEPYGISRIEDMSIEDASAIIKEYDLKG